MNARTPDRTKEERDLGYAEAKAVLRRTIIEEAARILKKNTYEAMKEARELLERAAASFGESV